MFGMSGMEMFVIAVVALVAIGPKDLPKALRMAGQFMAKVRRMAGEFQSQFNEAIREADLEELRKNATDINDAVAPFKSGFDPLKSAGEQLQKAIGDVSLPADPIVAAAAEPANLDSPAASVEPAKKPARAKRVSAKASETEQPAAEPPKKPSRKKAPAVIEAPVTAATPKARKPRKLNENA